MKNRYYTYLVFILVFCSCSDDTANDLENNTSTPVLTNYIYTAYDVSNTPNTPTTSTTYNIDDNKIMSAVGTNTITSTQHNSSYSYINGHLDEIRSFSNNVLSRIQSFTYNANNDLVTYISESIDTEDQTSNFERHLFIHTADTIFASWTRSDDGITFDTNVSDFKIVLDANDNRTYLETYSYLNDDTTFEISTYDSNSNLVNESKYLILNNGNEVLSFENNYGSTVSENLFTRINEATYTRKTMMLLYHLQSNALNNINAKGISKNTLASFESTWGNGFAQYEILNILDDNDYTLSSDFKTIIQGEVFARFTQEFILE